jgi:hypothetical protein
MDKCLQTHIQKNQPNYIFIYIEREREREREREKESVLPVPDSDPESIGLFVRARSEVLDSPLS